MEILLCVPAHSTRFIEKARSLNVPVLLDLEDGCPPAERATGRKNIAQYATPQDWVRVSRQELEKDLDCLPKIYGTVVPQARPDDFKLSFPGKRMSTIESAMGLEFVREIAQFSDFLVFGIGDLAANMESDAFDDYARKRILVAGRAFGLPVYDSPTLSLKEEELEFSCRRSYLLGFTGKIALHPREVEAIQKYGRSTPDEEAAYQEVMEKTHYTMSIDGTRFLGPPHRRRAEAALERNK